MSQRDVLVFLKKNTPNYFTPEEMGKILNLNIQSIHSSLKQLSKFNDVDCKAFLPKQGPPAKKYSFLKKDDYFEEALHIYKKLKSEERFGFMPSDVLSNLIIVKELKKIVGLLKDGKKTDS